MLCYRCQLTLDALAAQVNELERIFAASHASNVACMGSEQREAMAELFGEMPPQQLQHLVPQPSTDAFDWGRLGQLAAWNSNGARLRLQLSR